MENKNKKGQVQQQEREVLAKNIQHYLGVTGKLQKDVAQYLSISECCVSDWLHLRTYPRRSNIILMAELFNCTPVDLTEKHLWENKNFIDRTDYNRLIKYLDEPQYYELFKKITSLPDDDRDMITSLTDKLVECQKSKHNE